MENHGFFGRLRQFDAYPKTLEDFRIKTYGGGAVTIVSSFLMFSLFVSEFNYYLTTEIKEELFVDTSKGQKLRIHMDVTFPKLSCGFLSIDAMDVSGDQQIDVEHNIYKRRLDKQGKSIQEPEKENMVDVLKATGDNSSISEKTELGSTVEFVKAVTKLDENRCESCYGSETESQRCCNTCEDVREAYRKKGWAFNTPENIEQCKREGWSENMKAQENEGCQVYGYLEVNKVAGNFHIAPGKSFQQHHVHVHDLQPFGSQQFNSTHIINHLSFGKSYPGKVNPLDGTLAIAETGAMMYQYFIKVVPTTYMKLDDSILYTNQFSVTRHQKVASILSGEQGLPGFFIMYELSPMMVKYTEVRRSFMHFLTGVCAIIGGVFTVAGLIDSFVYHSSKVIQKKIELGKAN